MAAMPFPCNGIFLVQGNLSKFLLGLILNNINNVCITIIGTLIKPWWLSLLERQLTSMS